MATDKIVEVAAGVLIRSDGSFLLAQRPLGKIWAGYWEFPGGKVEPLETPCQALLRELQEELGITVQSAYPWLTRVHTYTHATVRLHFFRVWAWSGALYPHEGQQFAWQHASQIAVAPVLPANIAILRALQLPPIYAISNAAELGCDVFLLRLEQALQQGLRLLQVREKRMQGAQLAQFAAQVVQLSHRYGARVLFNGAPLLARQLGADGVHYSAAQLLDCRAKPDFALCSASCHSLAELQQAGALGFDFAVLSPVLPTLSHPGAAHLGWEKFARMLEGCSLPVYALGGLTREELGLAQRHGAQGVSLLRQAWQTAEHSPLAPL